MAQEGVYNPSGVISPVFTVTVAGVVRDVLDMSWACDITGGLPSGFPPGGTGIRSWTGHVTWAQSRPVEGEVAPPRIDVLSAFTGGAGPVWPPRDGDRVEIRVAVDGESWRLFVGRVGETRVSLDGEMVSEVHSAVGDRLRTEVTVPPTCSRYMDITQKAALWNVVAALEYAGIGLMPAQDRSNIFLHASFQAGASAYVGKHISGGNYIYHDGFVVLQGAPEYQAAIPANVGLGAATVLARVPSGRSPQFGYAELVVYERSTNYRTSLSYFPAVGKVFVYYKGTLVAELKHTGSDPYPVFGLQMQGTTLKVWMGDKATTIKNKTDYPSNTEVDRVVARDCMGVTGWYQPMSTDLRPLIRALPVIPVRHWFKDYRDDFSIDATRGVENVTASSVVNAWAEATLSSMWETETGEIQSRSRRHLVSQRPARTIRVEERIFSGEHLVSGGEVQRRVTVHRQESVADGHTWGTFATVYEPGRGETLHEDGNALDREWFYTAPANEEWGRVNTHPHTMGPRTKFIEGLAQTSLVAATASSSEKGRVANAWIESVWGMEYTFSVEQLGQRTLKFDASAKNVASPFNYTITLMTPNLPEQLGEGMAARGMPLIRAQWKTTWTDFVEYVGDGPWWAPDFEWRPEWYLSRTDAMRVARELAEELTTPRPVFSRVDMLWDPTRQIGDIERWESHGVTEHGDPIVRWTADVLITSYTTTVKDGVPSQVVGAQVVTLTDNVSGKRYVDLAAAYNSYGAMSGTYGQVLDALPDAR